MCEQQNPQTVPTWTLDYWWGVHEFPAVSYGPTWNGWVTPVVTKETLVKFSETVKNDEDIMEDLMENEEEYPGKVCVWIGDDLWIGGSQISPNEDGTYSFGFIGWTFIHAQEDEG